MKKKLFLISNMYPSSHHPNYGIFVKNFENVIKENFIIEKIVIEKENTSFLKFISYLNAYLKIIFVYFKIKEEDIIYIHFPLYFAPVLFPFFLKDKNVVLNFHGSDAIFNTRLKKIFFSLIYSTVRKARIVVPSNYYKLLISNLFKINESSILVYPSGGVNKDLFFRKKKQIDTFTLGFVSNFVEEKGWREFLNALERLKNNEKNINFNAIMIGSGPDFNDIKAVIKKLNVRLISSVKQDQLNMIYNEMDLFVFPTHRESLGLVGIEAMMCGIPVIASKVEAHGIYSE